MAVKNPEPQDRRIRQLGRIHASPGLGQRLINGIPEGLSAHQPIPVPPNIMAKRYTGRVNHFRPRRMLRRIAVEDV